MLGWLFAVLFASSLMISCSDDDSPADSDIFVGRYEDKTKNTNRPPIYDFSFSI